MCKLPEGRQAIRVKWVYRTKYTPDGDIQKHKARLVAKGCVQEYCVDYDEIFDLVAGMEVVRLLLALATTNNWLVYQLEIKSAFLNGELKEEEFVEQPRGFEILEKESFVYKLHKALYRLK